MSIAQGQVYDSADKREHSVGAILDEVRSVAEGEEGCVTVGEIMSAVGSRSYGPLIFVPALLELSPLGAIPAVPTLLAAIVAIVAVQIVVGRRYFWMPNTLERRTVSADKLEQAIQTMEPVTRKLDDWFHCRMPVFAGSTANRVAAVSCVILCLTVPPLELVPFASAAPMAAIALFGLAMTVRDGALMLGGFLLTAVAFAVGYFAAT